MTKPSEHPAPRRLRALLASLLVAAGVSGLAAAGSREDIADAMEAYKRGDYPKALQLLKPWAEQGNIIAQYNLGLMYLAGQGVPQDPVEAVRWWRKAAELGQVKAQLNLGIAYLKGTGVPQDDVEAMRWLRRAADQGDSTAQLNVGYLYEKGQGVAQDYAEALKWYRYAVTLGNPAALVSIGMMLADGRGVAANPAEAIKMLQKAAELGDPRAKPALAGVYGRNAAKLAAQKQYPKAIAEFDQALRYAGDNPAPYNDYAWVLATADAPSVRNGRRAVELALKAGELSDYKSPPILDTLAAAYARSGDFAKAVEWQEKALADPESAKDPERQERLRLYREGRPWPPR